MRFDRLPPTGFANIDRMFRTLDSLLRFFSRRVDGSYVVSDPPGMEAPGVPGGQAFDVRKMVVSNTPVLGVVAGAGTALGSVGPVAVGAYSVTAHASGTSASSVAARGHAEHQGAGTVTVAYGVQGRVVNAAPGTIGTAVALRAEAVGNTGGGTVTNALGIQIAQQTAGSTLNRAINADNSLIADYSAGAGEMRLLLWDVTAGMFKRVRRGGAGTGPGGVGRALYIDD